MTDSTIRPASLSIPQTSPIGASEIGRSTQPGSSSEESSFRAHLSNAMHHIAEGEATMNAAMARATQGAGLSQTELITLQTNVYRYTQELELASKLVDRATQAVKQTVQSQQ